MADYKELIFSDDFKAYRKKQLLVVVEYIHGALKSGMYGKMDNAKMSGALEMATRLLRLPAELISDKNLTDDLSRMIQEDLLGITTYLVRKNFD